MIRARFVVMLAVALAAATGCGSKGSNDVDVDSSLTAQRAQQRVYELMTDTLKGLPGGVALSKEPGNPQLAKFDKPYPLTVPCWDGNLQSDGPRYVRIPYWVVGLPAGGTRDYFDRITRVWQEHDWRTVNSTDWILIVETGDGYTLQLQDADKGDGSLSITGSSPCIPQSALEPLDPDPLEIKAL
ncbi:hypothetical protein [Nocardia sp. NPDC127526]|uniref:hypothetical protein n=1 Tax=Nocardia sp. NPDC127526 TaxID=3345393 RepID=UPI00363E6F4B